VNSKIGPSPAGSGPLISVLVCTYGRAAALDGLLKCLEAQTYPNFEVLVLDGNGENSLACRAIDEFLKQSAGSLKPTVIKSQKGLTKQRNVGLGAAKGSVICFLDDDVTFEPNFLEKVAAVFEESQSQDVGGITPYDPLNYPMRITWRWRLRRALGVIPSLDPGKVDHLGRAVPISFLKPWNGRKEIGWLAGFCMIYRRSAIGALLFDEMLPTYGGEDRDFSMRVGKHWRLLICGDLAVRHHYTTQGRETDVECVRQGSFGVGRRFGQNARSFRDYLTVASTFAGDFVLDILSLVRRPTLQTARILRVRSTAFFEGFESARTQERPSRSSAASERIKHQTETVSGTP